MLCKEHNDLMKDAENDWKREACQIVISKFSRGVDKDQIQNELASLPPSSPSPVPQVVTGMNIGRSWQPRYHYILTVCPKAFQPDVSPNSVCCPCNYVLGWTSFYHCRSHNKVCGHVAAAKCPGHEFFKCLSL